MNKDWVLDVLADLKAFARENDLPTLAEQLDDTIMVAAADIRRTRPAKTGYSAHHERKARDTDHRAAASDSAT